MKKQNFKSLKLNKKSISNFEITGISGGITGHHWTCNPSHVDSKCCPATVVHTCNYSDERTCTNTTF
ncbi:hypothetical protein [Kordia zhangzhouensis]|uniref:hypothetical protein n=1 Tax=Kordia zhangzhouensis TaxID=1620405 RepID=UPI000629CBA6|nr:hypothetical protein [Kordia zhangzhouensis]